jgi:hypothetical protein
LQACTAPSCAVARVHAPASGSAAASHVRLAASRLCTVTRI